MAKRKLTGSQKKRIEDCVKARKRDSGRSAAPSSDYAICTASVKTAARKRRRKA